MLGKISGWANNPIALTDVQEIHPGLNLVLGNDSRGAIPRGLGRSYGDSAINSGGTAIDSKRLNSVSIDPVLGIAVVGAGVKISQLERESLVHGFFPYVVPGTAYVTIGGAIASDIHGKSHHKIGSFSNFILELRLMEANGNIVILRPEDQTSDYFWATVGGMGLTGMIIEATITLRKIDNQYISVNEKRAKNLKELLDTLIEFDKQYLYTVAWIDFSGNFKGRGIVSGGNHLSQSSLPKSYRSQRSSRLSPTRQVKIPRFVNINFINQFTISLFNAFWFHKPLGKKIQKIQKYMHPLDNFSNWNVVYGRKGFLQYQIVIPFDCEYVLQNILSILHENKCGSFLTVLKSLGAESRGLMSFPMSGWTLAIDFPIGDAKLSQVLRDIDDLVLKVSGRIYLTKDSRMSSKHLSTMYPRLDEWKKIKSRVDPDNVWQSDQGRRLKIC